MTIKKTQTSRPAAAPGGAAIADRLKLDIPDPNAAKASSGSTVTFVFALIALGVAGILTYTIWKHWEFLMPA